MPREATLQAERADLLARLPNVSDPDLQQAIQDRVDFIQAQVGQAASFGLAAAVTKGSTAKGKKN